MAGDPSFPFPVFSRIQFDSNTPDSFEYLVNPSKLDAQLKDLAEHPESPLAGLDLLKLFTDKTQFRLKKPTENEKSDENPTVILVTLPPFSKRQLSLLKLAARVTTALRITLQDIEACVPVTIQYHFLRWLIKEGSASGQTVNHYGPWNPLVLYHRWVIRCIVRGFHFSKLLAPASGKSEELAASASDSGLWGAGKQLAIKYEETDIEEVDEKASVQFLCDLLQNTSARKDLNPGFLCQVSYELGEYNFFRENFQLAIDYLGKAESSFQLLVADNPLRSYCTVDLQRLKNTTLACRAITRTLTEEEKSRSLLLQVEELERKRAYDDLVKLLYQGRDLKRTGQPEGSPFSYAYLRYLQEQISRAALPSALFQLQLFVAMEMFPKGAGIMASVLSSGFYEHLRHPNNGQDRLLFFSECQKRGAKSHHPTMSEFVNAICGMIHTEEMRQAAAQVLGKEGISALGLTDFVKPQSPSTEGRDFLETLGSGALGNKGIQWKRTYFESVNLDAAEDLAKRLKVDQPKLQATFLKDLMNRGRRLFAQGLHKEAEECFLSVKNSLDHQRLASPEVTGDLHQAVLYYLFFLKLKLRTPNSEDALTKSCVALIRENKPPPFRDQVFLLASLISLGHFTAVSNVVKELTYSKDSETAFLDETSYLCAFVSLLARLLAAIGPQPGNLDGADEQSLRAIWGIANEFINLNAVFLTSSARMTSSKMALRDRYFEIMALFFGELDRCSVDGGPNPSPLLKLCLQGFIVGELYNQQFKAGKGQEHEAMDQRISFDLFSPWSFFTVSSHLINELQEPRITKSLRGVAKPSQDLSLRGLKNLLKVLQETVSPAKPQDFIQKAEVDLFNADYFTALETYLNIGLIETSHWANVAALKNVWTPATIQKMVICCMHLKWFHFAAILSQFSRETDYGRAMAAIEQGVEQDLFAAEHLQLFWDCALQELVVGSYKKKGNQAKVSQMLQVISRFELGQEAEQRDHFVNQLYCKLLQMIGNEVADRCK